MNLNNNIYTSKIGWIRFILNGLILPSGLKEINATWAQMPNYVFNLMIELKVPRWRFRSF